MNTILVLVIIAIGIFVFFKLLKSANEPMKVSNHNTSKILFLDEQSSPNISSNEPNGQGIDINSLLNYSNELYNKGDNKEAVRCLNKALNMNPSYMEEIALHRNRAVSIISFLGLGRTNPQRNLDYCIAVEHILRDFEAIIGLYVTNEEMISKGSSADFFRNCFDMAISNYLPLGDSIMAYQDNGEYRVYENKLPEKWKICFVNEPKNALSINSIIYPHHTLPE